MSRFMDELAKVCKSLFLANVAGPFLRYVTHADESALQQAKQQAVTERWRLFWLSSLLAHLGPPLELSEEEKRAMQAAVFLGRADDLAEWLKSQIQIQESPADEDAYLAAYLAAFGGGKAARLNAAATIISQDRGDWLQRGDGRPNAAGRFILSLSDADLAAAGRKAQSQWLSHALRFLLQHATSRIPAVADAFVHEFDAISADCCRLLLEHDQKRYHPLVMGALKKEKRLDKKALVLALLADQFPNEHTEEAKQANLAILYTDIGRSILGIEIVAFQWLVHRFGASLLPEIESYLSSKLPHGALLNNLTTLTDELGPAAAPGLVAAVKHPSHEVRLDAISRLIACNRAEHEPLIASAIAAGLGCGDPKDVIRYIGLAGRWRTELLAERLWALFEHKSRPVRAAAARALGRLGDEAASRAGGLLGAKKAAVRSAAVLVLAAAQTPAAADALEGRLDDETDEEVRDQILLALDKVWQSQGKKITRKQIDQRIDRTADKLAKPAAAWIDEQRLPPLAFAKGGEKLKPQAVRYLLYRQSRAREMQPDVECKPLYALIDRKTSGDFALAVLRMYFGGKMAAEDRWALAVAGLLGDDRVVAVLLQQIRAWVDGKRGKLAEYAAQALALLGSDVALCAVDALSIRYRSKQKNIGKAAAEAFAEAAQRQGITVDELGDRVVPWLGFEPGKPRLIEHQDKRIEVRIGLDFKLEFRDLAKGKRIASLPAGIPAEVNSEFKDLAVTLREVLKGQLARIENLMVRQFRWLVGRWRELFLAHPVLFPFAVRLAWGLYGSDGRLLATFRALEDRTLTNAEDENVDLPADKAAGGTVGIVHPLELPAELRQAWAVHLADYNVQSPFLQLERPVVRPADEEKAVKISSKYKDTELNGMTFKGRAERLGWQRGSVVDAGGISSYRKSFPGAGADAILDLEGMYVGMDMYSNVTLGRFCFVKSGSVSAGSYVYDEPSNDKDPRLLSFEEVPPIVFSETLGDLVRIAGTKEG